MKLSELRIGQNGIVIDINIPDKMVKKHLMEMGLIKGTKLKMVKIAPTGDPICIEIRGYELAIRKAEARFVIVEVVR